MQSTGQAVSHEVSRQSRHKRVMTHVIDASLVVSIVAPAGA
jgi:hypothetical protein